MPQPTLGQTLPMQVACCAALWHDLPRLYSTPDRQIGLFYESDKSTLSGMSDADWAVKHSTSGFVFMMSKAAISWGSKKQQSVALSSCEAEIVAASEAAKEAIYLDRLYEELGFKENTDPIKLYLDNKAAIDSSYNPENHARTKHIDRRHYFVRELVEEGRLVVPFVSTTDNYADFFTCQNLSSPEQRSL